MSGGKGRNYSWPPFELGNTAALRHGAGSARVVSPIAAELEAWANELAVVAPWASSPAHAATVSAWAWAEARCQLVRRWLDERQTVNAEGEVPPAATYLEVLERRARNLRADLGLGPLAEAKLLATIRAAAGPDTAEPAGVEALREAGRRMIEARAELVAAGGDPDLVAPVADEGVVEDQDDEEDQ